MFEGFFATMRAEGVPVASDEWLALQDALGRGLADSRLSGFYLLARALCVKNERHYDAYDVAFARYFGGVAAADDAIADQVWEWLDEHPEALRLSPEQRARLDALLEELDHDEIRRRLQERLDNQTEAHRGGSKHIGTGGTSPFGHSGYHPGGFRIGGEGRNRSAVQVAAQRRWKGYRADETLGVREMGLALRRLRQLSTRLDGPLTELDLEDTIDATADGGGRLHLVFRRPRRNAVRVLLLLDVGGSMDEHARLISRLFSAVHQATHFRDLTVRYFHNCVYDRLFETPFLDPARADGTLGLLAQLSPEYKLVIVGDGCMAPSELVMPGGAIDYYEENAEPGQVWLRRLREHFTHAAWLNPIPESWWDAVYGARTLNAIRTIFPMHELSLDGLDAAVAELMVRR